MTKHNDVKEFYDNFYYKDVHPINDAVVMHTSATNWHLKIIASRLGVNTGNHVLDIACGTGDWLAELKTYGANISGIDISRTAVETAQRRFPGSDVREGVAEDLPFDDNKFDCITCLGSLEHFLDQPLALREMIRVAKRGATILILVPNSGYLYRKLGLRHGTEQAAIQETVRSVDEWTRMIEGVGLNVRNKWRDLHTFELSRITRGPIWSWPKRALSSAAPAIWPMRWQYQVYFLCEV